MCVFEVLNFVCMMYDLFLQLLILNFMRVCVHFNARKNSHIDALNNLFYIRRNVWNCTKYEICCDEHGV